MVDIEPARVDGYIVWSQTIVRRTRRLASVKSALSSDGQRTLNGHSFVVLRQGRPKPANTMPLLVPPGAIHSQGNPPGTPEANPHRCIQAA